MDFDSKKAENCFANAENYEYRITMTGEEFAIALEGRGAQLRVNSTLRRPTFLAILPNGTRVKGLLARQVIKAGFVPEQAATQRQGFEQWLHSL
jgi:hypothetical protein